MGFGGLLGLLILILDIWAIINVVQSPVPVLNKLIWILIIFILPLIGLIIWYFAGPKKSAA